MSLDIDHFQWTQTQNSYKGADSKFKERIAVMLYVTFPRLASRDLYVV